MKHVILTLGLVAVFTTGLTAQTVKRSHASEQRSGKKMGPEDRAKKDAERAEKNLALNAEQKTKWEAASLERAKANVSIREKMEGCTTPEERKKYHTQLKENQQKYTAATMALLTPEQKAKHEQLQKEKRAANESRMQERRHRQPTPQTTNPQ